MGRGKVVTSYWARYTDQDPNAKSESESESESEKEIDIDKYEWTKAIFPYIVGQCCLFQGELYVIHKLNEDETVHLVGHALSPIKSTSKYPVENTIPFLDLLPAWYAAFQVIQKRKCPEVYVSLIKTIFELGCSKEQIIQKHIEKIEKNLEEIKNEENKIEECQRILQERANTLRRGTKDKKPTSNSSETEGSEKKIEELKKEIQEEELFIKEAQLFSVCDGMTWRKFAQLSKQLFGAIFEDSMIPIIKKARRLSKFNVKEPRRIGVVVNQIINLLHHGYVIGEQQIIDIIGWAQHHEEEEDDDDVCLHVKDPLTTLWCFNIRKALEERHGYSPLVLSRRESLEPFNSRYNSEVIQEWYRDAKRFLISNDFAVENESEELEWNTPSRVLVVDNIQVFFGDKTGKREDKYYCSDDWLKDLGVSMLIGYDLTYNRIPPTYLLSGRLEAKKALTCFKPDELKCQVGSLSLANSPSVIAEVVKKSFRDVSDKPTYRVLWIQESSGEIFHPEALKKLEKLGIYVYNMLPRTLTKESLFIKFKNKIRSMPPGGLVLREYYYMINDARRAYEEVFKPDACIREAKSDGIQPFEPKEHITPRICIKSDEARASFRYSYFKPAFEKKMEKYSMAIQKRFPSAREFNENSWTMTPSLDNLVTEFTESLQENVSSLIPRPHRATENDAKRYRIQMDEKLWPQHNWVQELRLYKENLDTYLFKVKEVMDQTDPSDTYHVKFRMTIANKLRSMPPSFARHLLFSSLLNDCESEFTEDAEPMKGIPETKLGAPKRAPLTENINTSVKRQKPHIISIESRDQENIESNI